MFFWFDRDNHKTKLPKVLTKFNNKHISNKQKNVTFSEKNKNDVYPKYSPLPAINSKCQFRKLERQRTYVVTNPVFVKPTKPPKERKKSITFKEFKKGLNKKHKNKTNKDESGMIWVDF